MRTLILPLLLLSSLAHATGEDSLSIEWIAVCNATDRVLVLEHRCFSPGVSGCRSSWPVVQVDFATMKQKTLPAKTIDQLVADQKLSCRSYQEASLLKRIPQLQLTASATGLVLSGTSGKEVSSVTLPPKQVRGNLATLACDGFTAPGEPCWSFDQMIDGERRAEDGGVDLSGEPWQLPLMRRVLVFRLQSSMVQVRAFSVDAELLEDAAARVLNDLGVQLLRAGDPDGAAQVLVYAAWRHPNAPYNLACAYARQGFVPRTLEVLRGLPLDAALVKKISRDADFDRIRSAPEFKAYLSARDAGQ